MFAFTVLTIVQQNSHIINYNGHQKGPEVMTAICRWPFYRGGLLPDDCYTSGFLCFSNVSTELSSMK